MQNVGVDAFDTADRNERRSVRGRLQSLAIVPCTRMKPLLGQDYTSSLAFVEQCVAIEVVRQYLNILESDSGRVECIPGGAIIPESWLEQIFGIRMPCDIPRQVNSFGWQF